MADNNSIILSELQDFRKESNDKLDKIDDRLRNLENDVNIIKRDTDKELHKKERKSNNCFFALITFASIVVVSLAVFLIDKFCK